MSRRVRDQSTLPADLRELAILMVAKSYDNDYERHHHEPIALGAGVTTDQLGHLSQWRTSPYFSPVQRMVLRFAEDATVRHHVTDEALADVTGVMSSQQVVELALTVGWYHLCHVLIDSLRIEREFTGLLSQRPTEPVP
jgi:alkylhydroperoxidase family enzyme